MFLVFLGYVYSFFHLSKLIFLIGAVKLTRLLSF